MSLLPEGASFAEVVQDCFLAYRGSGLMLSALDAELLSQWSDEDVPVEVIARGIQLAAEKAGFDALPDAPLLRSLRQCRRTVAAEIQRYKRARQGRGRTTKEVARPEVRRHRALRAFLAEVLNTRPELTEIVHRIGSALLADVPGSSDALARVETHVFALLLRALPLAERVAIHRQSRQTAMLASSRLARSLARRFHRAQAVRLALGMRE